MDLSKLSDEELKALYAQVKGAKPKIDAQTARDMDVTADMSWHQKLAAGGGKAIYDMGRGLGNIVSDLTGAPQQKLSDLITGKQPLNEGGLFATRDDTDAAKKRDAALMDTGWGMTGNILANLIPAVAMPATSIPKALLYGAGLGASQPVGKGDSRTENALMGAGMNAALPAAMGGYKVARAVAEPIMAPGKTAARVLEQFADDPQALRLAAQNASELVPGSKPTLAQVAQQPGISSLERGAMNQSGPLQKALSERYLEQNGARVSALDDLAGADGRLDFQKAVRSATAEEQYAKAFGETPADTAWIKGEIKKLSQRPAFASALKEGQAMAMDMGIKVSPKNPENATQILHFTKMALDDQIEAAVRAGSGNRSRALIDTRDKLVSLMESKDFSPSYREARDTFKQMSGPINEMETAGALRGKLVPPIEAGVAQPQRLNPNSFMAEVQRRDGDIAKFAPDSRAKLEGVMADLQRKTRAEGLGKATGSPTAQYLTTQNLMRQVMGPMGLPAGMADKAASSLMSTPVLGSAVNWATKGAEQRVQQEVANLLLNPQQYGQSMAALYKQRGPVSQKLAQASPYMPALGTSGLFAAYGRQ